MGSISAEVGRTARTCIRARDERNGLRRSSARAPMQLTTGCLERKFGRLSQE